MILKSFGKPIQSLTTPACWWNQISTARSCKKKLASLFICIFNRHEFRLLQQPPLNLYNRDGSKHGC